jgi:hypothetical protein
MGKASSAKKIKRVQQAGVNRTPGQRRNLAFPALIVGIVVLGLVFVYFARDARRATASVAPTTSDTWLDPFGVDVCGQVQDRLSNVAGSDPGFQILENGLIQINPKSDAEAGENATFGRFANSVGVTLGADSFTLPNGTTYTTGAPCPAQDGQPTKNGRVALFVWPPQANKNTEPRVVTAGISEVRFTDDNQIMVLGFTPEGETPQLPPTVAALDDPSQGGTPATTAPTTAPPTTAAPETTAPATDAAPTTAGG